MMPPSRADAAGGTSSSGGVSARDSEVKPAEGSEGAGVEGDSGTRREATEAGARPVVSATLFLVPTPIGNLEDMTLRALRVLREVDIILAEDTRHTRILLNHYSIKTPLRPYHAHSTEAVLEQYLEAVAAGSSVALVSDAGMPLVSDPGESLVRAAVARGLKVCALPGASALITALAVSGFPVVGSMFLGFAPRSGQRRQEMVARAAGHPGAVVFFESPRRMAALLADLIAAGAGLREVTLCRELTKRFEEVRRGTVAALAEGMAPDERGEMTLVLGPTEGAEDARAAVPSAAEVSTWLASGESPKALRHRLQAAGLTRDQAYALLLAAKPGGG